MRILGVIPARGGSKRLPRKNIKKILGRHLIDYTISAANKSSKLTDVIFSTDDAEILQIARNLGAFAPFQRPAEISGDEVRNSQTMIHALKYMEEYTGEKYDAIMLLQPTSPLRDYFHIDEAIERFVGSKATTLASVKGPYKKRDINLKIIKNGSLVNLVEQNQAYYIYNAAIYIVSREWLLSKQRFTSENEVPYIMDDVSSIDVDDESDFIMARSLIEFKANKNETPL